MIDTFLAKVTYVAPAAYDAQGHLRTEATIKLDVYATKNSTAATPLTLTNGEDAYPYAVGDYVLLNAFTNAVNSATESGSIKTGADKYGEIVSKATSIDGAQSVIYYNAKQHNVEGTVYDDAVKFYFDNAVASTNKFTWFFDQYNNLIGNVEIAAATSYGVINSIWWAGNAADGSGVAKANVTYMDGTTAVVDLSKMTYVHTTPATPATESVVSGTVTHSTGNQDKVMSVGTVGTKSFFFVDSYINTNAVKDVDGILNDNLFQFTTQANGTLAAVEVATLVPDAKFFNENLFVSKNTQYNGGNLIVDDATVFLVRNNAADPYTFKSIVGLGNIDNYAKAEVDFVDLNGDKVADYVYVIADPVAAKVTSLFYYANEQVSYDAKTGVYTIPGYVDGVKGNIYGSKDDAIVLNLLNALRTQATNKVAGGLFKVALSNNYVKDYAAIAAIGTESSTTAAITAFTGYPMAAAYTGYTVKVDSIVGAEKDTYKNSVYTDYVDGLITGDKFYTVSGNGVDGLTKMPLALGDVTTQNVIVVYNADPAATSATLNRLALQVYAVNKVDTSTNPDPLATSYTYTLNIVNKDTGAVLQSYAKTVKNPDNGTYTITLNGAAAEFGVSTAKLTAFGPDSITLTIDSTVGKLTDSGVLNAYYAN